MSPIHLLHLDLGIGGAERLMVNVAVSLLKMGHEVTIVTTHHDLKHCFDETKPGGILYGKIRVYGSWLPSQICGRGTAFCSHLRILYASLCLLYLHCSARGDDSARVTSLVVVDGISSPLPLFLWVGVPTIFYCHYPDKLLCTSRQSSLLARLYRMVLDGVEQVTTGCATTILVNSLFTKDVFRQAFPTLWHLVEPAVLYPCLEEVEEEADKGAEAAQPSVPQYLTHLSTPVFLFVSLNRFERKKRVELALEALALIKTTRCPVEARALLIIAGGYDPRVAENKEYLLELQTCATQLGLVWAMPETATATSTSTAVTKECECDVIFRLSIAASEKNALLHCATALLYTPDREHFGIVPLEAMRAECPVIAVNSGGPLETVLHDETGFLCEQSASSFASAMERLLSSESGGKTLQGVRRSPLSLAMGSKGRKHVSEHFSSKSMAESLRNCMETLDSAETRKHQKVCGKRCMWALSAFAALCVAVLLQLLWWRG